MSFDIIVIVVLLVAMVAAALWLMRDKPAPATPASDAMRDALTRQGFEKVDDATWTLKGKAKSTVFFKVPQDGSKVNELWLDRDKLPKASLAHPGLYLRVWPKGGAEAISSKKSQFMQPADFMPGLDVEARISLKRHGENDGERPAEAATLEFIKNFTRELQPNIQDLPGFELRLGELDGSEYRLGLYWTEGSLEKAMLVMLLLEERLP